MVEDVLSRIAAGLVERGVRRMIVAGGETSGAFVKALGADALRIGPEIDPGVPWTATEGTGARGRAQPDATYAPRPQKTVMTSSRMSARASTLRSTAHSCAA